MTRTIASPRAVRQAVLAGLASWAVAMPWLAPVSTAHAEEAAAKVELKRGDTPPDLVGLDIGHDDVRVSQHAGKVVVVSFWATWCGYCLKELPVLANIQRSMGRQNVQVIAVNVEDRDTYRRVRWKLDGYDLINAYDPRMAGQRAYGVNSIPHLVIIGRDGKVQGTYRGYGESALPSIVQDLNRAAAVKADLPEKS
jgi:thiol-disulfide isomerase/thioredoxin